MKTLLWIKWAGGIETRDDGWTVYHDLRYVILHSPTGVLEKYRTAEEAKRVVIGGGNHGNYRK